MMHMTKKRFYTKVSLEPVDGGFAVLLDGKPIKTPVGTVLCAEELIAHHMAAEWEAQGDYINPDLMPVTRIVSIALDRVPQDREALIDEITRYAGSDLLCYRAPAESVIPAQAGISLAAGVGGARDSRLRGNDGLREKQAQHFNPILEWAAGQGIALAITDGVMPITQPEASLAAAKRLAETASDTELAALAMATPLFGSALLALAVWKGRITVEDALIAARLDEEVNNAKWGEDPEAAAQWARRAHDIRGCAVVLALFS
jgi:chaperone required for assembly of F1-ATPase